MSVGRTYQSKMVFIFYRFHSTVTQSFVVRYIKKKFNINFFPLIFFLLVWSIYNGKFHANIFNISLTWNKLLTTFNPCNFIVRYLCNLQNGLLGIIAFSASKGSPSPDLFSARTRNKYSVPSTNLSTCNLFVDPSTRWAVDHVLRFLSCFSMT
jgi:hypothetical protein